MTKKPTQPATVYFDGACPVCSREVAMYQRQTGAQNVHWVDVALCAAPELGVGLTREAALARLHLRQPNGDLVSGAAAFTALWRLLPAWAWLGRMLGTAGPLWLLEASYSLFLWVRRSWRRA